MYKYLFSLFLALMCRIEINAQDKTTCDIAYPLETYIMQEIENSIYFQSMTSRWNPNDFFVRVSGLSKIDYQSDLKTIISEVNNDEIIQVDLIGGNTFDTIKTVKSLVRVGIPKKGNKEVSVQFIGDSYTEGEYFKYAFIESGYVPNISLVGTRSVNGFENYKHEGRGGWTVDKYCSTETGEYYYNPFFQPKGDYRYWGSTAFWRNCFKVKKNPSKVDFEARYHCSNYDLSGFLEIGLRKDPIENDMMWDSDSGHYVIWKNNRWQRTEPDLSSWTFNYGKYLNMHNLKAPDFMVVMLGLNDFRDGCINPDFSDWNNKIIEMAKSYHESNPDGMFIICTPCSSCGIMNNEKGYFTIRQNAIMWKVRKNIIDCFGYMSNKGIYVVDTGATIDNENGYNFKNGVQTGNPHPYPNYPALAMPIAAFVQYYREIVK